MPQVKVKVVVMAKDEEDILPYFLEYYGYLFGFSNIHLADNFSVNKTYITTLKEYEKKGVIVKWQADNFIDKGNYLLKWMKELYPPDQVDLVLFVDLDEFVVFSSGKDRDKLTFSSSKEKIWEELQSLYQEHPEQPSFKYRTWAYGRQTQTEYTNIIKEQQYFSNLMSDNERAIPLFKDRPRRWKKLFFNPHLTEYVQQGYHQGTGNGKLVVSNLALLHYHYRSVKKTVAKAWRVIDARGYPRNIAVIKHLFNNREITKPISPHKMEIVLRYYYKGPKAFLQDTKNAVKTDCIYQALRKVMKM